MTEAVFQFKAINRRLNRQEQKAEFEEKNPPIPDTSMYGWPYGVAVPLVDLSRMVEWRRVNGELWEYAIQQGPHGDEFVKMTDGTCLSRPIDFNAPPSFMGVKI
jgi:hypothetical protein